MRLRSLLAPIPLAALAVAAFVVSGAGGKSAPAPAHTSVASAWRGLVGSPRPEVAIGQRMIVVLSAPSLADVVARHGGIADDSSERRWTAAALAAQQQFLADLAKKGVRIRPEHRYARVLNGFSAPLDPRAVALLERTRGVRGVYAVRAAFPATTGVVPLSPDEIRNALAYRPRTSLAGFDGSGVTIALLDTGVDTGTPFLHGHVLAGLDLVGDAPDARAHAKPGDPGRVESHGTEMAGILVGTGAPAGLTGVAPGATVLPLRVAGWQRDSRGGWQIYGRTDQILAGLERAVDPNVDGDAHDAARVALIALAEPFAAFSDGPLARAAAGAQRLDTLVVSPSGNDGPAGPSFGSVSGPGGAPAVLTVGAADLRPKAEGVRLVVRTGLNVLLNRIVPLAGTVAGGSLTTEIVAPRRLYHGGFSAVAGDAALLDAGTAPRAAAEAASAAGAAVLLFAGGIPPGALGLDERVGVPALAIPARAAARIRAALRHGRVEVALARPRFEANRSTMRVAPFSSWGLAFDGAPKPELAASGVGVATAEPGSTDRGGSTFTTVNGSSAAAATVAGAAALLVQARPSLGVQTVRSLLIGSARPLDGAPVSAAGAGVVDVGAAAASELATFPATISFGRGSSDGWSGTQALLVRNVSTRRLVVYASLGRRSRKRTGLVVELSRKRLELAPRASVRLTVRARVVGFSKGSAAGGVLTLTPEAGPPLRVPWAVALAPVPRSLLGPLQLSAKAFAPSEVKPAVVSFRAGSVSRVGAAAVVQPVLRLDVELWTAKGKRLGLLARVRDLLPGNYAIGLTGRGPAGHVLRRGAYRVSFVAWPTAGGRPSSRSVGFRIARPARS